ncbi:hypothetical protein OROHE_016482 [Orobanche hederae]
MEPRADHNIYDDNRKKAMDSVRQRITEEIWKSMQNNSEVMEQIYGQEEDEELTDYEN